MSWFLLPLKFPELFGRNYLKYLAYGVFIFQFIRYTRACSSYECFILRARRLSSKLFKQRYLVERFKSSFRKFYGRYGDLIQEYEVSLSRMLNEILSLDQLQWLPNRSDFPPISWPWYQAWPSPNYEWFPWIICNGCGMPAGNAYPSWTLVPFLPPFGDLLILQLLRPVFQTFCVVSRFFTSYTPRYFLHFASRQSIEICQVNKIYGRLAINMLALWKWYDKISREVKGMRSSRLR